MAAELTAPAPARTRRWALAALAASGVLWGGSFPIGKAALAELAPAHLVLYRFALAAVLLLPFARWRGLRLTGPEAGLVVLTAGLTVPGTFLLQFEGLDRTTATSAALLVATVPPMLALAAWLVEGERPGKTTRWAVVLSAVSAAALIGLPGPGRTLLGDTLVFGSVAVSVAWILLTKRLMRRWDALTVTAMVLGVGLVLLTPFVWVMEGPPPVALPVGTWAAIVALGVACTALTNGLWNWGLHHVEASRAGVFVNIEPLVGALIGIVVLGEPVGPPAVLGGAGILAAAWLVTLDREAA
ncbi:MAG: EamA family transporter [Rhodothermales bacterium]|nr:EamA family transporter [Rhodothermales bacterium]